jgi:hypothetical protein
MFAFVFGQRIVARTTYGASQCNVHPHLPTPPLHQVAVQTEGNDRKYPNYIITLAPCCQCKAVCKTIIDINFAHQKSVYKKETGREFLNTLLKSKQSA